jgi:hypothetical protein
VFEALHPLIEFVIAHDPSVVLEMIEQVDHQRAFVAEADVSALIYVTDVDQDRVGIFLLPVLDLCRATSQSAAIWTSVVVGRWQNVTVQIRRMQDRNTNRAGIDRRSGARERRDSAEQSRPAGEFQEIAATPNFVL